MRCARRFPAAPALAPGRPASQDCAHDPRHRQRPRQHRAHRPHDRALRHALPRTASSPRPSRPLAERRRERVATYAKRWAAKEACSKALGTGLRMGIKWRDMGVVNLRTGQPTLVLTGWAAERLAAMTPPGHARPRPPHPDRRPPLGDGRRRDRGPAGSVNGPAAAGGACLDSTGSGRDKTALARSGWTGPTNGDEKQGQGRFPRDRQDRSSTRCCSPASSARCSSSPSGSPRAR